MHHCFSLPPCVCFHLGRQWYLGLPSTTTLRWLPFYNLLFSLEGVLCVDFYLISYRNGKSRRKRCDALEWFVPIWTLMLPLPTSPLTALPDVHKVGPHVHGQAFLWDASECSSPCRGLHSRIPGYKSWSTCSPHLIQPRDQFLVRRRWVLFRLCATWNCCFNYCL